MHDTRISGIAKLPFFVTLSCCDCTTLNLWHNEDETSIPSRSRRRHPVAVRFSLCPQSESLAEFPQVKARSATLSVEAFPQRNSSMQTKQRTLSLRFRRYSKKFVPNLAAAFFQEMAT